MIGLFGLGEDPFSLYTRMLKEFKEGKSSDPGVPKSTINWWCWGHPGFQDCHKLSFQAAQHQCASAGKPDDPTCLVRTSDTLSKAGCPCPASPPPTEMSPETKTKLILVGLGAVALWAMLPSKKKEKS